MPGTNAAIGGGGFHHVAVRTADFDSGLKFYSETLGMKPVLAWGKRPDRAVMLDTGDGSCVEIFERTGQHPAADDVALAHFAFRTDNCDAAVARIRAAGYKITMEPTDLDIPTAPATTPVRIAFCKGPDGIQIEFFQAR